MPIEIRELVIKATVQQDGSPATASGSPGTNDVKPNEEIITSCLEKIMEVIKERNER